MIELNDIQRQLVLAMLGQMGLTFLILLLLPVPRIIAIRSKQVKRTESGHPIFPKWATQVSDTFNNQFQVPVLFYALVLLALTLRVETSAMALWGWVFLGLRVAHAAVFLTTNFVPLRFALFLGSAFAVLSILLQIARRVLGI
jgi:hypothetical protein